MAGKAARASIAKKPEDKIRARNEAKILKAAVGLFARKGFDGTRIAEIAEASQLPKANVYYYFANKEDIYTTLIEQVLEGWDKALEEITFERGPREALGAYIAAKIAYSHHHAAESRFFANEMLRGGGFLSRQQRAHIEASTRARLDVMHAWMDAGQMAPLDARHLLILLWSVTQFYSDFEPVSALALGKKHLAKTDFARASDVITKTILDGCL